MKECLELWLWLNLQLLAQDFLKVLIQAHRPGEISQPKAGLHSW